MSFTTKSFLNRAFGVLAWVLAIGVSTTAIARAQHEHHQPPAQAPEGQATPENTNLKQIPDVSLLNQDGEEIHFYSDLVAGKVVAMNFIFTTCTTICRPMGAIFAKLQRDLGERAGEDVHLISVSIDPVTDTPNRLKAWSQQLGAGPGWTLVTGEKSDVDRLLKSLEVFTPDFVDHAPTVLVGNAGTDHWKRAYGLSPTSKLIELIDEMTATDGDSAGHEGHEGHEHHAPKATPSAERIAEIEAARGYFTDVELVNQHGDTMRLYSDLLQGNTVVISPFFTSCQAVCPVLSQKLAAVQEKHGDRLGQDLVLISISVDPETDTVPKLKAYAAGFNAKPGWYFLSGEKENVDRALYKLGQYVENPEGHTNVFIVGNEATGLWKKVFGLGPTEEILTLVDGVLNDTGG